MYEKSVLVLYVQDYHFMCFPESLLLIDAVKYPAMVGSFLTGYLLFGVVVILGTFPATSFHLQHTTNNKGRNYRSRRHLLRLDVQMDPNNSVMSNNVINDQHLLNKILEVAVDASKKAGDIIIGNAGPTEVTQRKANSRDLLTLIDPLCEKVLV